MRNQKILEFMKKVSSRGHPEFIKRWLKDPSINLNKVDVVARGKTFTEESSYPRGIRGTDTQMTDEELVEKFRHNACRVLTQDKTERVVKALLELEAVESIPELMKQLSL